MLSPSQIFEDNIRPADLMLKVFRLLEHDAPNTEAELHRALRELVRAEKDEGLTVIYNEIFLGLIRERAQVSPSAIRRSALSNLLRQAIVCACTALETFLPALLRANLDGVIKAKKREFVPKDKELMAHLDSLKFDLADVLRILTSPDPLFISNKLIAFLNLNLSGRRGVHVVGLLLGIDDPWRDIAKQLDRKPSDLATIIEGTISRRNDIVHRADRDKRNLDGDAQSITLSQAMQAVDTIKHVCLCLDELVAERMKSLRAQTANLPEPQDGREREESEGTT
jgi:hypothetical protein